MRARLIFAGATMLISTLSCSPSSSSGGEAPGSSGGTGGSGGASNATTTPVTIASGQKSPGGIVVNAQQIVWTTTDVPASNLNGQGSVMALPVAGGTPVALATGVDTGAELSIDSTDVYWFGPDDNSIAKVPTAGGTVTKLEHDLDNSPYGIALDATSVYWNVGDAVRKVPIGGGTLKSLASGLSLSGVYQQPNMAVNASGLFLTTADSILSLPLDGGTPTTIASGQSPVGICADATNVYWLDTGSQGANTVMKVAAGGGAPVVLATAAAPAVPAYLAIDADNVYWVEGLGHINKVPIAGGAVVALAAGPEAPGGIAVDATSVYWTDTAQGTVLKIAK